MKSIYKKKVHLLLLAVLCLTVLLFIPQKAQAAAVKKPSQVKNLTVKLTAKRTAKLTWKKAAHAKKYQVYCSVNGGKYKKIKNPYTGGYQTGTFGCGNRYNSSFGME